jgi:hypothetical protein
MASQESDQTWTPTSSQSLESQILADQLIQAEFGDDTDDQDDLQDDDQAMVRIF